MNKKEEFELAAKAFCAMTAAEKGICLTFFKFSKASVVDGFIECVYKTIKPLIKTDE